MEPHGTSPQPFKITPAQMLGLLNKWIAGAPAPVRDALKVAAAKAVLEGRPVDLEQIRDTALAALPVRTLSGTLPQRPSGQEP